ncbi:macromolecule synthesis protein [Pseudomonas sp. XWY-1]|uniref:carbamoyltransferase C-terminal domain-containing protein n=1 Tax=unclassified Pseudomonas TaxID=196821 RepID=UPI000CDC01DD|nr:MULTISPECIES: carbamoyltransferase C-terminal domain-containing protein [unclassified Pseudomonas]QNV66173.1 proline dehydrogenase [Pseudomonas sp. CFA]HEN8707725.1 proline dehydrogenase [Pseudomonas putida]AUZ61124.1 macromolecule synthesis protein [Pseudomonas sp. XWY-1]MCX2814354.1 proline dehydrogenase [Pseudomonas sp. DCB_E]MCX9143406.1 proline dehydrogenase [Pseudomonas sp. DCB_Q]
MRILSYNIGHDGQICLIENGNLIFSYEAEKNSNPRYSANSPSDLLKALTTINNEYDAIAVSGWAKGHDPRNSPIDGGYLGLDYNIEQNSNTTSIYCSHELSHIICSYALSKHADISDCYVLLLEGFIGNLYYINKDLHVQLLQNIIQSPGLRYSFAFGIADPHFNLPKGYCRLGDAGKMMALAGLGENSQTSSDEQHMLDYLINCSSPIDTFCKADFITSKYYNIGPHTQPFCNLARKISNTLFEHIKSKTLPHITKRIPLLISGGCGLNCDWNKQWEDCGLFSDVFVPPCTNDTGVAIGAAALAQKLLTGRCGLNWSVYSGQPFLHNRSSTSSSYNSSSLQLHIICKKILAGEIVCWVQGRCEIGPRALGNRSILASPFSKVTTQKLNKIKKREDYRPVAPICLEQDAPLHFEDCKISKYMLSFYKVINTRLQAITHADGTARVQTVAYEDNPTLYTLLATFKKISGIGVLCNTSLNFSGAGFINNRSDLEKFCTNNDISTFVIDDMMYTKAE